MQLFKKHREFHVLFLFLLLSSCVTAGDGRKLQEEANTTRVLMQLSKDAENAFEYEKAAEYYSRIQEILPKNIESVKGVARNLRYAGIPKEAIKIIKNHISKFGKNEDLKLELLKAQLAAGMLEIALRTAVELETEGLNSWQLYSVLGIIYDQKSKYSLAQKKYAKGLELSPKNPTILNNLALSLAQNGEVAKAINLLEPLINSENTTAHTRQTLALLYNLSGFFSKGKDLMKGDLPTGIVEQNMKIMKSF
jgi:Flp pilus assembly protein TadD